MPRQPPLYRNLDKSCFTFPFDFSFGIDSAKQNPMQCRTFIDSSVMDAVFTSDAADGTHETNSRNTVAENSDVAGADENSGERMSAANDDNLKAQPANEISTEKEKHRRCKQTDKRGTRVRTTVFVDALRKCKNEQHNYILPNGKSNRSVRNRSQAALFKN